MPGAENRTDDRVMPEVKRTLAIQDLCRAVGEASPLAMASVDEPSHVLRYVNPAFCLLVKKPREELIGRLFAGVLPAARECLPLLDRVYRTAQAETHIGEEHSAGHPFYWSYSMWPVIGRDDRMVGIIIQVTESTPFLREVTAMNQALILGSVRQHELTATAEDMNAQLHVEITERKHAEEELQRANDDLRQFAHAASHDLQEPLCAVTLYSRLLARKLRAHLDAEAEDFLQHIVEGNTRMIALINDLLAYAQAGDERQQGTGPVECAKAVKEALANLEGSIEETHAEITSDPLPSVNADLPQLTQVFQNLIGNAFKDRNPERRPDIHIAAESREDEWAISVRDNGIGFETQYAEQIFGLFKRLHSEKYPGTGIGLAICKRIVERHRGSIWATSEAGKGATFFFTLPKKTGTAGMATGAL
jgi:signal transduction histidine kinase